MPYVQRDDQGHVSGVFMSRQPDYAEEYLPEDHPDVVVFLHRPEPLAPLSRRQFFQVAAMQGYITQDEALDAVQHGAIPAQLQQFITSLPQNQQFGARMLIAGASEFDRHHALAEPFAHYLGITDAQMDAMWQLGVTL